MRRWMLCAVLFGGCPEEEPVAGPWRVYAVEQAYTPVIDPGRLVHEATGTSAMSWYFFVLTDGVRVVLVDAGSRGLEPVGDDPDIALFHLSWGVTLTRSIPDTLASVGLTPEQVTDIIVTHRHWDHADGIRFFPDAAIHMTDTEHALLLGDLDQASVFNGWSLLDAPAMQALLQEPSTTDHLVVGGEAELPGGLRLVNRTHHTEGFLTVTVPCADGPVILAGDGAHLYRSLEQGLPSALVEPDDDATRAQNVADISALLVEVGARAVLPGHDPEIFQRWPTEPHTLPGSRVATVCDEQGIREPIIECAVGDIVQGESSVGGADYADGYCTAGQGRACYPGLFTGDLTVCGWQDCDEALGQYAPCVEDAAADCSVFKYALADASDTCRAL